MKVTIETTDLGIVYAVDKPFLRGLAHRLDEALDELRKRAPQLQALIDIEAVGGDRPTTPKKPQEVAS